MVKRLIKAAKERKRRAAQLLRNGLQMPMTRMSISTSSGLMMGPAQARGGLLKNAAHPSRAILAQSHPQGQVYYDFVVQQVGCSTATDTLDCLRKVSYDVLSAAFAATPDFFSYRVRSMLLSWQPTTADTHFFKSVVLEYLPRVDGVFLTDNPQQLVLRGEVANVPFVAGSYPIQFSSIQLTSYR